jgi:outer membrane receptor protein involved in Fe transport
MYHALIVRHVMVILRSILTAACLVGGAIAAGPVPAEPVSFDISKQPLRHALKEFARQSDRELLFSTDVVEDKIANDVAGTYEPEDALELLLADTGLEYSVTASDTILVAEEDGGPNAGNSRTRPILMAQNQTPATQTQTGSEKSDDDEDDRLELEEIVVTGTHIRGQAPVGANLVTITRDDIDTSGYATTQQVLQSLPQNFKGGANEDTRLGPESFSNFTAASTVNLRGLGSTSTLLLVNGRRIPIAGDNANFFDASTIPASAIERIEVLPDGASALYGSDAIAGVVNIVLRDDFEGAETRLRYGSVTDGDLDEYQVGLVFGKSWSTGRALLSYEYYQRGSLGHDERGYTASADLRPLGGEDQRSFISSDPGNILDPLTSSPAFGIPPGQDGTSLTPGDLLPVINLGNQNEGRNLLANQERHSAFLTLSQDLSDRITLFAEGRYSQRDFRTRLGGAATVLFVPPSNPFLVDPFGFGFDLVSHSFLDDLGPLLAEGEVKSSNGVLGGIVELAGDWQVRFYGSYSREKSRQTTPNNIDFNALSAALADPDPATAFNPFGDGSNTNPATLAAITSPVSVTTTSELWSANIVADGSLFRMPGGDVKLAVGADYREEDFVRQITRSRQAGRDVAAVFGELTVPLVGESNSRPGLRALTVSVAGRYEDYNDVGTTADPKVGAVWTPVQGLNVRGTWGTSFKAPSMRDLDDLVPFTQTFPALLDDPASPTGETWVIMRAGNNGDLRVETATSWTLGIDFAPPAIPGLALNLTYFNIDFKDRINSPSNLFNVLVEEERFSGIITRNPDAALVNELCNSEPFTGIGQDPTICDFLPIEAVIDARINNNARTKLDGIDFTAAYGFDTANIGRFDFRLNASYLFKFDEAITRGSPVVDIVDTVGNVIDLRMRNSVTWSTAGGFSATAFINYADGYTDNTSIPQRRIHSWTTVDLQLSYETGNRFRAWLDDTRFSLSAQNVFDEDPPFVNNRLGVGYDPTNADALGRFIALQITTSW